MTTDPVKDVFQVRAELYAPSRFPPKAYELFRTRALVTDVIAQQCWLYVAAVARLHAVTNNHHDGPPRVGIIGGGHMGCAVALALLTHRYPPAKIIVSTRQPDRVPKCDALATTASQVMFQSIPRVYDNARVSRESEVLILCIPPSQLKSVAIQIKHALAVAHSSCVVLSILCGTAIETLQKACGTRLVLRTLVNVPGLARRLQGCEDEQDAAAQEEAGGDLDALAMLRSQAKDLAAEQLATQFGDVTTTSPLARVLTDLTLRLDPTLAPSRATETVAEVLRDETVTTTASLLDGEAPTVSPEIAEDTSPPPHDSGEIPSVTTR